MPISRFLGLALASVTLLVQAAAANNGSPCSNPTVRREWRSLPPEERAAWMAAVKVEHKLRMLLAYTSLTFAAQCLNNLPHDPSLVPTFNTTYAAIPPVNTSSSYFDGLFTSRMSAEAAYSCLNRLGLCPHGSQSHRGSFLHSPLYKSSTQIQIHFTGQFLPWHRAYINDFDAALRVKCGYTGHQPYWDWTKGMTSAWLPLRRGANFFHHRLVEL